MAEEQPEAEREIKKSIVYEHKTTETSRSIIPALVVIGIIVLALLIYILTRLD
jgi:tRNA threonylcarbamoyladenosine modification (KEOPS) complex  Pcc1 subunit